MMRDPQQTSDAANGVSKEETPQEKKSDTEELHSRELETPVRPKSNQSDSVESTPWGSAGFFLQADTAPPRLCADNADASSATWREHSTVAEANSGADQSNTTSTAALAVAGRVGRAIKDEVQQALEASASLKSHKAQATCASGKVKEEQDGSAAAETERGARAQGSVFHDKTTAAEAAKSAALRATCGVLVKLRACSGCGKLSNAADGAKSHFCADLRAAWLCRACGLKCSTAEESTIQENGTGGNNMQEQNTSANLEESGMQIERTGSDSSSSASGSGGQAAVKTGKTETAAGSGSFQEKRNSKLHIVAEEMHLDKKRARVVSNNVLSERAELPGNSRGVEDAGFAGSSSGSAREFENKTVSGKAEDRVKRIRADRGSPDSERKTAKSESSRSGAEVSKFTENGFLAARQSRKFGGENAASAGHSCVVKVAKSASDSNLFVAASATGLEGKDPAAYSKFDVERSGPMGENKFKTDRISSADADKLSFEAGQRVCTGKERVIATAPDGGGNGGAGGDGDEEGELLQGGLSAGSEKKEYMASKKRGGGEAASPRGKPTSPRSLSPSPCHCRRKRRRADNGTIATRCKVNVGPRHQVPALPPFFLDSSCTRHERAERVPEGRELYSHDCGDTARLVYSPFAMQRVYRRRIAEGKVDEAGIRNAEEINEFIRKVAENWTNKSGWQPFSPEYAYKLLHFAGYDPQRALRIMKDSRFCFTTICDPPQRRYDNKWRPKDRRGQIATHPYPSPLTLRAYLSRRDQHAAATAAAMNASPRG